MEYVQAYALERVLELAEEGRLTRDLALASLRAYASAHWIIAELCEKEGTK